MKASDGRFHRTTGVLAHVLASVVFLACGSEANDEHDRPSGSQEAHGSGSTAARSTCTDPRGVPVITAVTYSAPQQGVVHQQDLVTMNSVVTIDCKPASTTALRYAWTLASKPAGSSSALSSASAAQPTFVPDVAGGTYVVSLTVSAAKGGKASVAMTASITVSLCGRNAPVPQIGGVPPGAIDANAPVGLTASALDSDSNPTVCPGRFASAGSSFAFAWSIVSSPTGSHAWFTNPSGSSTSFQADLAGTYVIRLTATDSAELSGTTTASIGVSACGTGVPAITQVTGNEGALQGARVTLIAESSDPDLGPACGTNVDTQFLWTLMAAPLGATVAGSGGYVPADPGGPPIASTLSFVPNVAGTYVFNVTAKDSAGHVSAPTAITVIVAPCSLAIGGPWVSGALVTGSNLTLSTGQVQYVCGYPSTFSYAWSVSQRPAGSVAQLAGPWMQSAEFTPDAVGNYQFTVTVTDTTGLSTTRSVFASVASCGSASLTLGSIQDLVGGMPKAAPDPGDVVVLRVSEVFDPNASTCSVPVTPYSYRWSLLSAPPGSSARLDSDASSTPALVPDLTGSYQISVVVTDALGNTSPPTYHALTTSNCGSNTPVPGITVGTEGSIQANAPVSLSGAALDDDANPAVCPARFEGAGTPLTFSWTVVSSPPRSQASLTSASQPTTTFQADTAGTYGVRLTATDGTGRTGTTVATVSVSTCGSSPPMITSVISPIGRPPVTHPATLVNMVANASDADRTCSGDHVEFLWRMVSAPLGSTYAVTGNVLDVPNSADHGGMLAFTPDAAGTYVFTVTARDSFGLTSEPFTVSVPTGPCGPGVDPLAIPEGPMIVGVPVVLTANVSDPALCTAGSSWFSGAWSLLSRPTGSTTLIGPSDGTLIPDMPGEYFVQFLATDAGGYSTAVTARLLIGACTSAPTVTLDAPLFSAPLAGDAPVAPAGFLGDRVTFSSHATPGTCAVVGASDFTYAWLLLSKPTESAAVLAGAVTPSSSFIVDVAGATFELAVTVTDGLGNQTTTFGSVSTSTCGSRGPAAVIDEASPLTVRPLEKVTLSGHGVVDNAGCPARLEVTTSALTWAVASNPIGATALWSAQTGSPVLFSPQTASDGTPYRVSLTAVGSNGVVGTPAFVDIMAERCAGVTCQASDACHQVGICDPATGICSTPPVPDGTACDDGDACTLTDGCESGVCKGSSTVVCPPPDACHLQGSCDPASGMCSNPPNPEGCVVCGDGSCGGTETCSSCPQDCGACDCVPVVNELFRQGPAVDAPGYVELFNPCPSAIELAGWMVVIGDIERSPVAFATLSSTIQAGEYLLIVTPSYCSSFPCEGLVVDPDNIAQAPLLPTGVSTTSDVVCGLARPGSWTPADSVGYVEGNLGEGESASFNVDPRYFDLGYGALARIPNGVDTNQNSRDFAQAYASPGAANPVEPPELPALPPLCGNGTCEAVYETCTSCPQDCAACGPVCGDHVCDEAGGETCSTCETDCGGCPITSGQMKINEVMPWSGQFVELYNPGPYDVDLAEWQLECDPSSCTCSEGKMYVFETFILGPGQYYVLGGPDFEGLAHGRMSCPIESQAGMRLLDASAAEVVDAVCFGFLFPGYCEGEPAPLPQEGYSLGRIPDGQDTNNNVTDVTSGSPSPGSANLR